MHRRTVHLPIIAICSASSPIGDAVANDSEATRLRRERSLDSTDKVPKIGVRCRFAFGGIRRRMGEILTNGPYFEQMNLSSSLRQSNPPKQGMKSFYFQDGQ